MGDKRAGIQGESGDRRANASSEPHVRRLDRVRAGAGSGGVDDDIAYAFALAAFERPFLEQRVR